MASPFSLFRKNQRVLMAVFGILAMIAFVVMDAGFSGGPSPAEARDEVVAATRYFDVRQSQLDHALSQRRIVQQFLIEARTLAGMARIEPFIKQQAQGLGEEFAKSQMQQFEPRIRIQAAMEVSQQFDPLDDRATVATLVLAEEARRLGIAVTDQRILAFIAEFVENQVPGEKLSEILRALRHADGRSVSRQEFNDAFRVELLAREVRRFFAGYPAQMATSLDRWNYYVRKECRASAEVLPVRTEDFLDKVPNPTERQLTEFYERYKYDEPIPGSPDPGFKRPQQTALQYFEAPEAAFFEPDKISAEEVAKHYEENKGRYPYTPENFAETEAQAAPRTPTKVSPDDEAKPAPSTPTTPVTPTTPPKADAKPTPPTSTPPTTTPAATPAATPPAAATTPKPTSSTPPAATAPTAKPSPTAAAPKPTATAPKSTGTAAQPKTDGSCEAPEESDASECQPTSATPAATGATTPAATPSAASTAPAPAASPTTTASPTPTASPTATPSSTAASQPPALPPPPLPADDVLLPDDIRTGRSPQYDPLWRVERKVRADMARNAARDKIDAMFKELSEKLTNAALAKLDVTDDKPIYTAEQWQELAKPYPGLIAKSTDLLSEPVIRQSAEDPGIFHATIGGRRVAEAVFDNSGVYSPVEALEIPESVRTPTGENASQTTRYLFWKTKHVPAKVPELAEIRDEVVRAWKFRQARDLVRKEAEQLAKQARETNKTLLDLFPGRGVELTNSFKWYQEDLSGDFMQQQQRPLRLSEVDGVVDPGPEFMRTVFSLGENQIGTAMNHPQTICYVVRLKTLTPSPEKLRPGFSMEHFDTYARFSGADAREFGREAEESLLAEAGLRWLREPRPLRER